MHSAKAVIGANYGDEGKGRTVDWLVSQAKADALVIRHNSGPQAGHTVVIGDKSHIFSHFGSGTLRGAPTLLCHRFVVNPILFNEEYDQLKELGVSPTVYVSANCAMTSPLDMALNQMRELMRFQRHGSVGVGFGETIDRGLQGIRVPFRVGRRDTVQDKLSNYFLREVKDFSRAELLKLPDDLARIPERLWDGEFRWSEYWRQYDLMLERIRIVPNLGEFIASRVKKQEFIFEGAQGLALHQDWGIGAPHHVTWSRTGTQDILEFLDLYGIECDLEAFYVTRTYLTRHGAGPFPGGDPEDWMRCTTNVANEWQGEMRFRAFDMEEIDGRILHDLSQWHRETTRKLHSRTMLTCCDQIPQLPNELREWADILGWGPSSSETEVLSKGD